jgi:hypothetical protein
MKNGALTVLLLIALSGASIDASAIHQIGAIACGTWVEDHQNQARWRKLVENQWLAGFLSGESVSLDVDLLADTDLRSLALAVTNYCDANPMSDSLAGALDLANQIAKSKGLCARGAACRK